MKFSFFKSLLLLAVFFTSGASTFIYSQDVEVLSDFQAWGGLCFEKKVFKGFKLDFLEEYRFRKDARELYESISQFGAAYKINRFMDIGVDYRFIIHRKPSDRFLYLHRFSVDFSLDKKTSVFQLKYRIKYQNKDDSYFSENDDYIAVNFVRNRLQFNYTPGKMLPDFYLSAELFYKSTNQEKEFSKVRYTLGMEIEIFRDNKIDLFYRIDHTLNSIYRENIYIFGIEYNIKI